MELDPPGRRRARPLWGGGELKVPRRHLAAPKPLLTAHRRCDRQRSRGGAGCASEKIDRRRETCKSRCNSSEASPSPPGVRGGSRRIRPRGLAPPSIGMEAPKAATGASLAGGGRGGPARGEIAPKSRGWTHKPRIRFAKTRNRGIRLPGRPSKFSEAPGCLRQRLKYTG